MNSALERVSDAFYGFFNAIFLLEWYVGFGLLFAACVAIGYFLPFRWVRAGLGFCVLLGAAFLAGGQTMYNHVKTKGRTR